MAQAPTAYRERLRKLERKALDVWEGTLDAESEALRWDCSQKTLQVLHPEINRPQIDASQLPTDTQTAEIIRDVTANLRDSLLAIRDIAIQAGPDPHVHVGHDALPRPVLEPEVKPEVVEVDVERTSF